MTTLHVATDGDDYGDGSQGRPLRTISRAAELARPGDTVLIAGQGHETGQEINGVKHPFDDRDVVAQVLDGLVTDDADGDA